jgi:hypothetical protein
MCRVSSLYETGRGRLSSRRATRLAAGSLIAAWLGLSTVAATVVPWMDLEDMSAKADVIVLGTVESTESRWSDDGRIIVTRAFVTVERPLKGGPRARVLVETPGGRVGDLAMVASGAPVFHPGERVVLFLEPTGGPAGGAASKGFVPRYGVVGWNQGRMIVRRDPGTGRDLVEDRTAGALYLDHQGNPLGAGRSGKGPAELQQFLLEVEHLIAGTTHRSPP